MTDFKEFFTGVFIATCFVATFIILAYLVFVPQPQDKIAQPEINNIAVINNYYCNTTELPGELARVNLTLFTNTSLSEYPPPANATIYNDTRQESIGLPADGYGNPCCPRCVKACEFPWWCKQQGGSER